MTIIGVWRALGAVAALSPAQEWASAGMSSFTRARDRLPPAWRWVMALTYWRPRSTSTGVAAAFLALKKFAQNVETLGSPNVIMMVHLWDEPLRLRKRASLPPDLLHLKRFPPVELSITSPIGPHAGIC
jgi:hypothetical protein